MNSVAVVLLNYNGEALLKKFLPTVIRHSPGATLVVADNGSTDGSVNLIKEYFPGVTCIALEKNFGYAGGYNRALSKVEANYLVLLNTDVEVTEGWLAPLSIFDKDKSVAAVQPKILSYQQRSYFDYAGAGGGFIDALGYPFCRGRYLNYFEKDEGQYNDTREIFWASGACLMIRQDAFREAGGFDEDFFAHMEEIEVCWKLQRLGHQIFYDGRSTVYHMGGGTLSSTSPKKTFLNFRNNLFMVFHNWPASELIWKLPLRGVMDFAALLKFLFGGTPHHAFSVLKAYCHFIFYLPREWRKRRMIQKMGTSPKKNQYHGILPLAYYLRGERKFTSSVAAD